MVKTWEKHDQSYVSNSVKDNFSKRIAKNIGSSIMPYSEYLKNKFILAYFGHKITEKEMEKRYPGVIDQFINISMIE